jgi:predicted phosphodiesterase
LARIGIMADSHGETAGIEAAAIYFRDCGCALIVHLGDICDTTRPETATACLERLNAHQILAIRGNNDHTLLLNRSAPIGPETLETIRKMPLTRQIGSALLAHSLPFASRMGPRCMLEDMDHSHLRRFFRVYPGRQLFRGHSHQPQIVQAGPASFQRETLHPDRTCRLDPRQTAVVTCGALADGLCLLWDRQQETIELVSLAAS